MDHVRRQNRWRLARRLIPVLIALTGALIGALTALAQDDPPPQPTPPFTGTAGAPVTDDQVNTIARQLYCPVCQNIPLDVCGTQACADWRQEIRAMLSEGLSGDEIMNRFAAKYGQRVLASPQRSGVNLAVWILPVVGVLAGALIVGGVIWRMAPGALAIKPSGVELDYDDLDPETVARLERELKEFSS